MKNEKVIIEDDELYRDKRRAQRAHKDMKKKTEKKQSRKWESFEPFRKTGEDNKRDKDGMSKESSIE